MKKLFYLTGLLAISLIIGFVYLFTETVEIPQPSDRKSIEEKNQFRQERAKWMEDMHRAGPGVDWRKIEEQNKRKKKDQILIERISRKQKGTLNNPVEPIIPGILEGVWKEIGSNNQAGRILTIDVDYPNELIYAASEGGNIWRGNLDGSNWESLNDYFQIEHIGLLKRIPHGVDTRMIAVDKKPFVYYTDDEALTWNSASGLEGPQSWGSIRKSVMVNDAAKSIYLVTSEWDFTNWNSITSIYYSVDHAESFIQLSTTFLASSSKFDLWTSKTHHSPVVMANSDSIYFIYPNDSIEFRSSMNPILPGNLEKVFLGGYTSANSLIVYAGFYSAGDTYFYQSTDSCLTWSYQGSVSTGGFSQNSFHVSLLDSSHIFFGGVNAYTSYNSGSSWDLVNEWWEYYPDPANLLHADIPEIESFLDGNGNEKFFISTDGGLYQSDNHLQTVSNISLEGLRVSQYYSVYSNKNDPDYVYAGSQDQGFQVCNTGNTSLSDFEQTISGDYGHIVSGNSGFSVWSVYPTFAMYNPTITLNSEAHLYDFNGSNYLWMPPLHEDPVDPEIVWLGGGGMNGGAHLIRVSFFANTFTEFEYPYDFGSVTNEKISAIEFSPLDIQTMYVATSEGYFHYSYDHGASWDTTQNFTVPGNHYFYGNAIKCSPVDSNVVFVGGSGYSNPAVFKSTDKGQSFTPLDINLPPTLVYELDINGNGTLLFAATESGPYVYVDSLNSWYSLSGITAPEQIYWSVEYVPLNNSVRFGTYGRGIWEFTLDELANQVDLPQESTITVYPNPFIHQLNFRLDNSNLETIIEVYNKTGSLVFSQKTTQDLIRWDGSNLNGESLVPGTYFYRIIAGDRKSTGTLIKL
jgi:hypothetical protein